MDVTHFNPNSPLSKIQALNVLFMKDLLLPSLCLCRIGLRACLASNLVFGAGFELAKMRPSTARSLRTTHTNRLCSRSCATRTLVGSQGFEPQRSRWDTASTARRFRPLSQLPERKLSKIWRKTGDSNAYAPKDTGLASQWDTSYPSLPGTNFKLDLKGSYRLDERHQA